jgi:hypothetical protein
MFCAHGEDQAALEALSELMDAVQDANHSAPSDPRVTLVAAADADGFAFDG